MDTQEQKPITINHKITCDFCGDGVGEVELQAESLAGMVVTNTTLGIADARCKPCEKKNGVYADMAELAEKAGVSHDEFKTILKQAGGKKVDFLPLLEVRQKEITDAIAEKERTQTKEK